MKIVNRIRIWNNDETFNIYLNKSKCINMKCIIVNGLGLRAASSFGEISMSENELVLTYLEYFTDVDVQYTDSNLSENNFKDYYKHVKSALSYIENDIEVFFKFDFATIIINRKTNTIKILLQQQTKVAVEKYELI